MADHRIAVRLVKSFESMQLGSELVLEVLSNLPMAEDCLPEVNYGLWVFPDGSMIAFDMTHKNSLVEVESIIGYDGNFEYTYKLESDSKPDKNG